MDRNVGHYDRVVRLGLGIGLLIIGLLGLTGLFGSVGTAMMAVAVVLIFVGAVLATTGLTESCPIYSAVGIDTCQTN
mgnify:CR=1 FL=1